MSKNHVLPTPDPHPTMTIDVDLRNPGQFFACCGLLELTNRVWGCRSLGWFEDEHFALYVPNQSQQQIDERLMGLLQEMTFVATDPENSGSPIVIGLGNRGEYRADWWLKTVHRASLRTWGRGTSYNLFTSLRDESTKATDLVSGFTLTAKMTGRLSVDPRSSWTAIDAGFSPNDQNFTVATFPLVEFLAGIGLQRNRPVRHNGRWRYAAWKSPLPSLLMPTAGQILSRDKTVFYTFQLAQRGQMTRYFTYSLEGDS